MPTASCVPRRRRHAGISRETKYLKVRKLGEGCYGRLSRSFAPFSTPTLTCCAATGVVYKAKCVRSGKVVAIKKYKKMPRNKATERKTRSREISFLRGLKHTNIVRFVDSYKGRDGCHRLVTEFACENLLDRMTRDLSDVDCGQKKLPAAEARSYMADVTRALAYLHGQGIMHRDIKPENVLVTASGVAKLCDFGMAARNPEPTRESGSILTSYVASRWYRAPELLARSARYGPPVDVWALGVLYAEMLKGRALFMGRTDQDQLQLIAMSLGPMPPTVARTLTRQGRAQVQFPKNSALGIRPLELRIPDGSKDAVAIIKQCLRWDATTRASCKELLDSSHLSRVGNCGKRRPKATGPSRPALKVIVSDENTDPNVALPKPLVTPPTRCDKAKRKLEYQAGKYDSGSGTGPKAKRKPAAIDQEVATPKPPTTRKSDIFTVSPAVERYRARLFAKTLDYQSASPAAVGQDRSVGEHGSPFVPQPPEQSARPRRVFVRHRHKALFSKVN